MDAPSTLLPTDAVPGYLPSRQSSGKPSRYTITMRLGATTTEVQTFIQQLSDSGKDLNAAGSDDSSTAYTVFLLPVEATELEKDPMVRFITKTELAEEGDTTQLHSTEKRTNGSPSDLASGSVSQSGTSETRIRYCIVTKRGTPMAAFHSFIQTLPDGGRGLQSAYPDASNQAYGTMLTPSEVAEIKLNPIVKLVMRDEFRMEIGDSENYSAVSQNEERGIADKVKNVLGKGKGKEQAPPVEIEQQIGSPDHLNFISQGPLALKNRDFDLAGHIWKPYKLLPEAGQGITIFVIDSGLTPGHPEFAKSYDPADFYIVPNEQMNLPEFIYLPDSDSDSDSDKKGQVKKKQYLPQSDKVMMEAKEHGDCTASLATGLTCGVAKKAHLVPIKYKNTAGTATNLAIHNAWTYVINRVRRINRGTNPPKPGWAVINFSGGFSHKNGVYGHPADGQGASDRSPDWEERKSLMQDLLLDCWENDIVTVVAAGNQGLDQGKPNKEFDLSMDIPACLGTPNNPLITVGACDINGKSLPLTTIDKNSDQGGSMTAWAKGDKIRCAKAPNGYQDLTGTSEATPQVAGLAAYFMSLPQESLPGSAPDLHIQGKVAQSVKDYLVEMSFQRPKGNVKAIYNGAERHFCGLVENNKITRRGTNSAKADEYGLSPLVVSGQLVVSDYELPTCPAGESPISMQISSTSIIPKSTGKPHSTLSTSKIKRAASTNRISLIK